MNELINQNQAKALYLIDRFNPKCVEDQRAFKKIEVNDFLVSLKKVINNPISISQGDHPICGIAALLKVASKLDPVGLVRMGAHLFANGEYQTKSFLKRRIKAPNHLKKKRAKAGLSAAGHVLQTTIKSFHNPITGYNNQPGNRFNKWQGITFPYQIRRFLTTYFKIDEFPVKTFRHTLDELEELLSIGAEIIAWTSWNQVKRPGGKFKLFEQHYVLIRRIERHGTKIHLIIDNPRKAKNELERYVFANEKETYRAIIGVYAFGVRD